MKKIFNIAVIAAMALSLTGCEDFLNRPTIDNYSVGNYYQNDEQCLAGVAYLYNSPWYDFQRGFISVGEVLSGNMYDNTEFLNFTTSASNEYMVNMSKSLWSEIGHCGTVIDNIRLASGPSTAVKRQTIGEALLWKAMAYFYLVRAYGEVPIIHDNAKTLNEGNYNTLYRNTKENLYDYVLLTLEAAEELLPKNATQTERVDYWSARALEAKVYLTMAGVNGSLNQEYLKKAADIAKDVIDNSGRTLMANYAELFYGENNVNNECFISWRWSGKTSDGGGWTAQNSFQNDLALTGFGQWGDNWGHWKGISVDLQEAFGVTALDDPKTRIEGDPSFKDWDARRKTTYMLPGDFYTNFWRDLGGFDVLKCCYDADYARYGFDGNWGIGTGAHCGAKHMYGNNADHQAMFGYAPARNMTSGVHTHLLRLADIYLVYAEACVLGGGDVASGVQYLNAVRARSIKNYQPVSSYTWEDVWKERRLELAMEGDRWYDYVRVSYYNLDFVIDELKHQHRYTYWGHDDCFKNYYTTLQAGAPTWDLGLEDDGVTPKFRYPTPEDGVSYPEAYQTSISAETFKLPIYEDDVIFNKNLASDVDPVSIDVRGTFSYDFSSL